MADDNTSLAVWDVPMPVVAGETFSIKVGAKSPGGRALTGRRVEVSDPAGAVIASGTLGDAPFAGTEALYWTALDVPAPKTPQVADYAVRLTPDDGAAATWFSLVSAPKPEHLLSITVTERDTGAALDGVEIRLGPFNARTDKSGRAKLNVSTGAYQLHLWRTAHLAQPSAIDIASDASVEMTMVHVPEEHPDARWVR